MQENIRRHWMKEGFNEGSHATQRYTDHKNISLTTFAILLFISVLFCTNNKQHR